MLLFMDLANHTPHFYIAYIVYCRYPHVPIQSLPLLVKSIGLQLQFSLTVCNW